MSRAAAHLYCRVSTDEQVSGSGLDRQLSGKAAQFCELYLLVPSNTPILDEGISAWDGSNLRPNSGLGKFQLRT